MLFCFKKKFQCEHQQVDLQDGGMGNVKLVTRVLQSFASSVRFLDITIIFIAIKSMDIIIVIINYLDASLTEVSIKPSAEPVLLVPFGLSVPDHHNHHNHQIDYDDIDEDITKVLSEKETRNLSEDGISCFCYQL